MVTSNVSASRRAHMHGKWAVGTVQITHPPLWPIAVHCAPRAQGDKQRRRLAVPVLNGVNDEPAICYCTFLCTQLYIAHSSRAHAAIHYAIAGHPCTTKALYLPSTGSVAAYAVQILLVGWSFTFKEAVA